MEVKVGNTVKQLRTVEFAVYSAIKNLIESEDIYCVHVKGIWGEVGDGLSLAQVKGAVGSLILKDAIEEVEPNHFAHKADNVRH